MGRSSTSFTQDGFIPTGKIPEPPSSNERAHSAFLIAKKLGCSVRIANSNDLLFGHQLLPNVRKVPHSMSRLDVSRVLRVYLKRVHEAVLDYQIAHAPVFAGGVTEAVPAVENPRIFVEQVQAATESNGQHVSPDPADDGLYPMTAESAIAEAFKYFRELAAYRHYRQHGAIFAPLEDCKEPECARACTMLAALSRSADEVDQMASELLTHMEDNGRLKAALHLAKEDAHTWKTRTDMYAKIEEQKQAAAYADLVASKPAGGEPASADPMAGVGLALFGDGCRITDDDMIDERERKVQIMHTIMGGELETAWSGARCSCTRALEAILMLAQKRDFDKRIVECYYNLNFSPWKIHLLELKRDKESKRSLLGVYGWNDLMVSMKRVQQKAEARRSRTTPVPSPT